jgi:triosephosphate isomerase
MGKIIVGNLKMNLITVAEREEYLKVFKKEMKGKRLPNIDIILCPSFTHIEAFGKSLKKGKVEIGAQDLFWERKGSYTGEVSPAMIKNLGAEAAIIGHSERRKYFQETDKMVNLKIRASLKIGINPIFCVGETEKEKEADLTAKIITRQIVAGLQEVSQFQLSKIIFAYEPVWAIGSGLVPSSDEILSVNLLIKKVLVKKYGMKYAQLPKIIYGGSVNFKIAKQVCVDSKMDGALVGGESLSPHSFLKIAETLDNA